MKAAHDVLRGVGPVDAEHELLRAPGHESRLPLEHAGIVAEPVELRRIDADRSGDDPRRATPVLDRPGLPVDPRSEQPLRREQERAPPALGVEADDVVCEQPLVHGHPQLGRQRVPVVGLRPRDVEEVRRHDVGPRFPHQARREVQVVVVEEDRRVGLAVELLHRRSGQRLVDRHVPVAPGLVQLRPEVRRGAQAPEVVLQEPERRVRQHVVEAVVGGWIVRDEPQPIRRAVRRLLAERAVLLGRDCSVLLGHRARHPGHVVVGKQAAEGRHDPAAAPPRNAASVGVTRVRDRRAIEDDEELPPGRCRC